MDQQTIWKQVVLDKKSSRSLFWVKGKEDS